jgi:ribosomal protein S18 acetylase RimI-like enzyme
MVQIRSATQTDIPAIIDITQQVWPPTYLHIIGPQQLQYMIELFYSPKALQQQMNGGHHFVIATVSGITAGFASWSLIDPGIWKLHKLYVLPSRQGSGIGKAIIQHIVTAIQSVAQNAELRLNVNRNNTPAINFYFNNGFTHLADEDIDIGNGYYMNDHIFYLTIP